MYLGGWWYMKFDVSLMWGWISFIFGVKLKWYLDFEGCVLLIVIYSSGGSLMFLGIVLEMRWYFGI